MSQRADLSTGDNSSTAPPPDGTSTASGGLAARFPGVRPLDAFAAAVALLLPVAILPGTSSYTFTPKFAVLLVVAAVGLPVLVELAIASPVQFGARAGVAFLAVGGLSTLVSKNPMLGAVGPFAWGNGLLFWCAVVGVWAIGARVSAAGRPLLVVGLIGGATVNAAMALFQVAAAPASPSIALFDGNQADGLMGNPVYLEALLLGALAFLMIPARGTGVRSTRVQLGALALVLVLGAALECTGERLGVALLGLASVLALAIGRSVRAMVPSATAWVGYAVAYALTGRLHHRLTDLAAAASEPRVQMWKVALRAFAHRPLFGFGPGEFASAITSYDSLALTRHLAEGAYFADGHDVFVQVGVTTGVFGLAAFVAFLAGGARRASGPLVGFALLVLAAELLEPVYIGVTPLALLALGAAGPILAGAGARSPLRPVTLALRGALVAAAVLAGAATVEGDLASGAARATFDYPLATRGARLLPVWPTSAALAAEVAENHGFTAPGGERGYLAVLWFQRSVTWRLVEVHRDPSSPETWVDLADAELVLGRTGAATADFRQALREDRWATHALSGLGSLDARTRRWRQAEQWFSLAHTTAPHDPTIAANLAAAQRHLGG